MPPSKAQKDPFQFVLDLTNGGRSLNAIWSREDSSATQKIILLFIANRIDFTRSFTRYNSVSMTQIIKNTSLAEKTVRINLKELIALGLISAKTGIFKNGKQMANKYALTVKLFSDYRDLMIARKAKEPVDEDEGPDLLEALKEIEAKERANDKGGNTTGDTPCQSTGGIPEQTAVHGPGKNSTPYSLKDSPKDSLVVVPGGFAAEARQLLRSVYIPNNDRPGPKRFVRKEDIDALAGQMLERFGIKALRDFKAAADKADLSGRAEWRPLEIPSIIAKFAGVEQPVAPESPAPTQPPEQLYTYKVDIPEAGQSQTEAVSKAEAERDAYAEKHRRTIKKMHEDAKIAWAEKQKKKHGGI